MSLHFYLEETLNSGSEIDPVDTFTGNGSSGTFSLVYKEASRLASTVTVESTQYYQYNGGFTKNTSNDTFTLSAIPVVNAQIVAPGISALTVSAFDQDVVDGVTNPRIAEVPFYLADTSKIHLQSYTNLPQYNGVEVSLVNLVSSFGADLSWCQLACANVDGTAGTYQTAGTALYTSAIQSFGTISASAVAGASSIDCSNSLTFNPGDYVLINTGQATQELRKVHSTTSTRINFTTSFDFPHYSGETIYACGRKFWLKVTIPTNAANNIPTNFYDVGLRRRGKIISRV